MWTTVNDVLELEAMQGAAVLAGHNGLGRQVKSVTVLDAPDATLWLRGNELALTSTFPLNKQYTNLNRLVPELVSRDVAGLGVKLSRYMKSLPQSMIDQANELAFPIVLVPDHLAWIELLTPIFTKVLETDARHMLHAEEIRNRFSRQLFAGASIEGLVTMLYSLIGEPVVLSSPADALSFWQPAEIKHIDNIIEAMQHPEIRSTPIPGFPGLMHKMAGNVQITHALLDSNTDPYASIAIINSINEHNSTNTLKQVETYKYLHHCRDILSMALMQRRASISINREKNNEFILALTDTHLNRKAKQNLIQRNTTPGINENGEFFLVLFKIGGLRGHSLRIATNLLFQQCEIESIPVASKDNQHFIMLLPLTDGGTHPINHAEQRFNRLIKNLEINANLQQWHAGMSQPTSLLQLHKAFEQAEFALKHSIKTGQSKQIKMQDETGLYKLFSHPAMAENIDEYINDWLGPIIAYDEKYKTRMLHTLRVFLDNNCNYREAARQLHVHHNTIRYRLDRLSQLTRRDLIEPQLRLQFQLAIMMHDSKNIT